MVGFQPADSKPFWSSCQYSTAGAELAAGARTRKGMVKSAAVRPPRRGAQPPGDRGGIPTREIRASESHRGL
jgi:hypothetical protein